MFSMQNYWKRKPLIFFQLYHHTTHFNASSSPIPFSLPSSLLLPSSLFRLLLFFNLDFRFRVMISIEVKQLKGKIGGYGRLLSNNSDTVQAVSSVRRSYETEL
ncbi:hypothetical protein RYX36_032259 [Vicia faba]